MTAGAPVTFPGSRSLAAWWRALAPLRPHGFWVAHLLLHRVEALVRVTRRRPLDPLDRLLLDLLSQQSEMALDGLDERLHLGRPLLHRLVQRLQEAGLVRAGAGWSLTPAGQQARSGGEVRHTVAERRTFHFLEHAPAEHPPTFLPLGDYRGEPWPAGADWRFDPSHLSACLKQSAEWKQRRGFPAEVEEVLELGPEPPPDAAPEWQRVVLDCPERLPVAVVSVADAAEGERLFGFEFQPDGWALNANRPVFTLGADWREVFPELAVDIPTEKWRRTWLAWCRSHNLTGADEATHGLEPQGWRLRITLTPALLRASVLKRDLWLLAGDGRTRAAAQVEVIPSEMPPAPPA